MKILSLKTSLVFLMLSGAYADTNSLILENDAMIGRDHHYTNGMYYTWMSENNSSSLDLLNFIDLEQKKIAFSISHAIFTPQNKKTSDKDLNDLPYAGYLGLNFLTYKSSANFFHELGFNVGMVGPSTQADSLQKNFHTIIGHSEPKGWDNQLGDDFLYGISYNVGYKTNPININDLTLDFTTNLRADLGNFYTGALVGGAVRLSSFPSKSFVTTGNFIGSNESLLLNYEKKKNFNWALSLGLFYNKFDQYYLVDEARDQGYTIPRLDYLVGEKLSFDCYYNSYKVSLYVRSVDIENKGSFSSSNAKTGGISFVWKWD